jgi:hypothetical protein
MLRSSRGVSIRECHHFAFISDSGEIAETMEFAQTIPGIATDQKDRSQNGATGEKGLLIGFHKGTGVSQ